jgi:hypothetical protein
MKKIYWKRKDASPAFDKYRLKMARKSSGLSSLAVSKLLGQDWNIVYDMERGRRGVPLHFAVCFAYIYNLPLEFFISEAFIRGLKDDIELDLEQLQLLKKQFELAKAAKIKQKEAAREAKKRMYTPRKRKD